MRLFIDTWGWLSLADRNDTRHRAAAACYQERSRRTGRVVTSSFVLDEFFTLMFLRRPFPESERFANAVMASPYVLVEQVTEERFAAAWKLRLKFSDKPAISFTDLTSMVIMKEMAISDVLTHDTHFAQVGLGFRLLPE